MTALWWMATFDHVHVQRTGRVGDVCWLHAFAWNVGDPGATPEYVVVERADGEVRVLRDLAEAERASVLADPLASWARGSAFPARDLAPESLFEVGEIINPEDWEIRLQITSVDPLEGMVVKSADPLDVCCPVGKVMHFVQAPGGADREIPRRWRAASGSTDLPWVVLGIYAGEKRFYR